MNCHWLANRLALASKKKIRAAVKAVRIRETPGPSLNAGAV